MIGVPEHTVTRWVQHPYSDGYLRWMGFVSASQIWCDIKLVEVTCWSRDNEPLQDTSGDNRPFDAEGTEPILTGHVKWDGCHEFQWNDTHVCNAAQSVIGLAEAWLWLLSEAHKAMTEAGGDPDWKPATLGEGSK